MAGIFGFKSPQEVAADIEQQRLQRAAGFAQTASSRYGRSGANLGAAFGGFIRQAIETHRDRLAERAKLEAAGATPEEAKTQARADVAFGYSAVRQQQRIIGATEDARNKVDDLIQSGVNPEYARAVGMMEAANRLSDLGMQQESHGLRQQASQVMMAEDERLAKLGKLKADTAQSSAAAAKSQAEMYSNDDTFIKLNTQTGKIEGVQSVAITDPEKRQILREAGYINVGNSSFGIQLDKDSVTGAKPIPPGVQENIVGAMGMLSGIKIMREAANQGLVGRDGLIPKGWLRSKAAEYGINLPGNEPMQEAMGVYKKMKADIQSIIKGIPSNYDASVFEAMIPNPGSFRGTSWYNTQLDVLERSARDLLELTIGFYNGTNQQIPDSIKMAAKNLGVDPNNARQLTSEQIKAIQENAPDSPMNTFMEGVKAQSDTLAGAQQPQSSGDIQMPGGVIHTGGIRPAGGE